MKKKHIDYFFELYEKSTIPRIFPQIINQGDQSVITNPNYECTLKDINTIHSVFFIPDYLRPVLDENTFSTKKIEQFFKGYAIILDEFANADAYIKYRFRSNAKGIRRRVRRLESCFQISYKTFYGEIKKEEYDFLMDSLEKMLIKRFEERNDVSQTLLRWEYYKNLYFSLINTKKASLFVIYENDNPIVVSLNHHFKQRLFSAISSYDIDFRKFSLGSVEIYKKLDWCIENNYKSYEMGMGDLDYKREWCNHIYNFQHQIIYAKKSLKAALFANIEYAKVYLKEIVYKIGYVRYKKYKSRKKTATLVTRPQYQLSTIEQLQYNQKHPSVNYNHKDYLFLRNIVFDFLYTATENVSDVSVVKLSEEKDDYLILGKSKMQKVSF